METLLLNLIKAALSSGTGLVGMSFPTEISNETTTSRSEVINAEALHTYAKIEQELTITKRTLISEVVEIEEYYGNTLKGGASAKVSTTGFNASAGAEGERVTKRIIRFTGFNSQAEAILSSLDASLLAKLRSELASLPITKKNTQADQMQND